MLSIVGKSLRGLQVAQAASAGLRFQSNVSELDIMEGLKPDEISAAYKEEILPSPPVKLYDSNGKRATLLWQRGAAANQLPAIQRDLNTLSKKMSEDAMLAHFVQNPSKTKKERNERISKELSGIKASQITTDFFQVLCDTNKLKNFPKILESFGEIMRTYNKEIQVTVVSASDLGSDEMDSAKKLAQQFLPADAKATYSSRVDPQIIGGMILDMGDQYIDLSVKKKLQELEEQVTREYREMPVQTIMGQVKKKLRAIL
eukprot:TRINITY_DN827_c0_g1_i2.p1 TRINITY_DN827_c0_g1~~TRINITY_DN827_c0_g1_i2.p1  ORF type:complete len:271 (-),score=55.16 TRINITY_DN827_c0_g1_i2:152-928(-)